ncbi:condensin-2 complex subunit G2-like isoform X2 [Halichondria panicea]|uniref:condensin-2 complex subunit G2-like isoform X2 n=1 Tax=Halichondria panicea TaxID=6063 RepID=UPI00312BB0D7
MKRADVISTIQRSSEDETKFLEMMEKHRSKADTFNLVEFFQALPKKQATPLWDAVFRLCQQWVGEEEEALSERALCVLSGIIMLIQAAMGTDDPVTPTPLRDTLQILHDILLGPLEAIPELQNGASQLCEGWWCTEREEREGLVPHTLLYIVARSLTDGALAADVKRVWSMRQAFLLLDFEDGSAEPFKAMLLSATLQPLYINTEEGRKFLSFLFGMHPSFVEDLHQTIKYQIPYMSNPLLETYGEVYLRAWRLSSGPYLRQIEEQCLQDLMFSAVHAPRLGQHSLFNSLRKFLEQVHSQRMQKGVSEMLHRLYSPFLWRSLKVANPEVRANACTLLLDAFPLQDPDSTREEIDGVMQKQFDGMIDLLGDASVMVRVSAVMGVCRVLSYYWEMIPAPVVKALISRMVKELAWDSAAVNVRVAVVQGMCLILENRLSHPLMVDLLPLLQSMLHDSSEKVRIAFLDLLLLVKGMRMIKFWHICPLEHLLARVEMDSVAVVKRIVSLLVDSFQPGNVSPSQQIERCVSLVRTNPGAARRFYQLAVVHLTPTEVTKFILAILLALMQCVETEGAENGGGASEEEEEERDMETNGEGGGQSGVESGGWKERNDEPDSPKPDRAPEESLCVSDGSVMCGLIETMVILWEGVRDKLDQRGNKGVKKRLEGRVTKCLPTLFNTFEDGSCRSALYLLAANLPRACVNSIATGTLTTLATMSYAIKSHDYSSLLIALTSWGQTSHVIKLTNEWLATDLQSDRFSLASREQPKSKITGKGRRGKSSVLPTRQPLLAVELIDWMLSHPSCLQELKSLPEFWKFTDFLKNSMTLLEMYYLSSQSNQFDESPPPFPVLHKCLGLYIRLLMHQQAEGLEGHGDFPQQLEEVLSWGDRVLVSALKEGAKRPSTQSSRQSSRKRKASQPPPTPSQGPGYAHKVTETLLLLLSEILLLGLLSGENTERVETGISNFGARIAETSSAHLLLSPLAKLLYQISEASTRSEIIGIPSGPSSLTPVLLKSILLQLIKVSETKPELLAKCLGHVKVCVGSVVREGVRMGALSSVGDERLFVMEVIVEVVVRAQVNYIKQTPGAMVPVCVEELPLLVASLVKQCCANKQSASVFLAHLEAYISATTLQPPELILTHQAALCLISALVKGKSSTGSGGDAMMRCVRHSLKIVETCSQEDREKWSSLLTSLDSLTQSLQDTLLVK